MKKFISILLTFFMLILATVPSFAAKNVTFTASDSEVFAGDEFTVDIFISDNALLKSAMLIVEYDAKAMQFLDLNIGAIVTAGTRAVSFQNVNEDSGNSYVQIEYKDSSASLSSAGKFLSLTFVANDTAIGETTVKLSASGNKISVSSGSVTPDFKNSKINIINNVIVTDSDPSTSAEESSSDISESSEPSVSTQGTAPSAAVESSSQNISSNTPVTKDKEKSNTPIFIAVAIIVAVVILLVLFDSNGKGNKKSKKKKRKKSRR